MLKGILRCDVFRVVQDRDRHLTPATNEGALVSAVTLSIMALLILSETVSFFSPDIRTNMFVDKNEMKKEAVHFNVTFLKLPCHHIVVEIFDPQTGMSVPELTESIVLNMERVLSSSPSVVVGEYRLSQGLLQFSDEAAHEGCRVSGTFNIDKVPGNFYMAGRRYMDLRSNIQSDHTINDFWIGDERLDWKHDHIPESLANALGGVHHEDDPPHTLYQYFLQIVPTYFEKGGVTSKIGYQYTATFSKAFGPDSLPPGVYFRHQHTSLAVEYRYEYQSWSHFLVHVCAVIGGVFTVMGFAANALERFKGKLDVFRKNILGK